MKATPWDPFRGGGQLMLPRLPQEGMAEGPVRVLAYVDRYPPFVNAGAEWMLHAMLRHLVRQGHVVQVATDLPRDVPAGSHVEGVHVYPAAAVEDLAAVADVAVGHLLWTREVIGLAQRHALPLLYLLHNDSQLAHWRLSPANVTALVPNSLWLRAATASWRGPQVVVRPPVLVEDYRLDRDPVDGDLVTLVNPIREKGVETLHALAYRRPDLTFATVGGGYGHQVRPPRELANVVTLPATGTIRDDVYSRTRVLLVPSQYESWGRVACEALCSGIPVIAHPTPGLVEALDFAGIFVDREDVDGWAEALRVLDDPGRYAYQSALSRGRAAGLDVQADRDLARWERLIRRAALAGPRLAAMRSHDPFAGHSPIKPPAPAAPPEPVHHRVVVDLGDYGASGLGVLRERTDDEPMVLRVPLDDATDGVRTWLDVLAIGAGDRVRLVHLADEPEAQWGEGTVVEVGGEPGAEWVAVTIDSDSQEDEALRAELRGIQTSEDSGAAPADDAPGVEPPTAEAGAQESPQGDPPPSGEAEPAGEPQGGQEAPESDDSPMGVVAQPTYPDEDVPSNVADVVAWIGDATSPEDQQARTAAAWRVEQARGEDNIRKGVRDVAAPLDHSPPTGDEPQGETAPTPEG